jgi:hypothetical protein
VRTGNLTSLSERDHAGRREFLAFAKQEAHKQRLAEDRAEYQKYRKVIEDEQHRVPPAHRIAPLGFEEWRKFMPEDEVDPVLRGLAATNRALVSTVSKEERDVVTAGKADPAWQTPASAAGLKMSIEAAKTVVKAQAEAFLEATPAYYPTKPNWERMKSYIESQRIAIPNQDVFKQAFERLSALGLLEQRPVPETEPAVPEHEEPQLDPEELKRQKQQQYRTEIVITDPRTGQGYTEYQLDRLPADEYKRLMIGEFRTPRITDVIKPAWFSAK